MSDQDKMVRPGDDGVEQRSLATDAAILATPVVIAAQPVIGAWANQHFSKPQDPPPAAEKPSGDQGSAPACDIPLATMCLCVQRSDARDRPAR